MRSDGARGGGGAATAHEAGSVEAFRASWSSLPASERYHFRRGQPETQVHFAFQNHWRVFRGLMGDLRGGRVLEVGCGRGSMGAFFADAGFETHLLDTSLDALRIARRNFEEDGLAGVPLCGDALALPYRDGSFDAVVSIGLLEHFADVEPPLLEQLRVLRKGGVLLGYVVPERPLSVQTLAAPANAILRLEARFRRRGPASAVRKDPLFRNDFDAEHYLRILRRAGAVESGSFGMFPLPLVSHSHRFPFSPMSPEREQRLISLWRRILDLRARTGKDPWICDERWGLAFLVWARR